MNCPAITSQSAAGPRRQHLIEPGPLIPALGAKNARIAVFLDHLPSSPVGYLALRNVGPCPITLSANDSGSAALARRLLRLPVLARVAAAAPRARTLVPPAVAGASTFGPIGNAAGGRSVKNERLKQRAFSWRCAVHKNPGVSAQLEREAPRSSGRPVELCLMCLVGNGDLDQLAPEQELAFSESV